MVLPLNNQIRFLVNSLDVIHSFAIPSLGIKVDAVPGRINQVRILINRPGLYYGQCSEICGVNHRFIPIVIERTNLKNFLIELKIFNQLKYSLIYYRWFKKSFLILRYQL